MAQRSTVLQFSEDSDCLDKAIPFSVEEASGVNDASGNEASGMLSEESSNTQLPCLEYLSLSGNSSSSTANPRLKVIVKYGNLEQQKADAVVYPLSAAKPDLQSLNVTKDLTTTTGIKFSNLFSTVLSSKKNVKPGDIIELPIAGGSYSLECKYVIFVICSIWNNANNSPEKDLRAGICRFLDECNSRPEVKSVAVSAIGTGRLLNFPNKLAATIMGEEIKSFVGRHPDTNIKEIQIVVKELPINETIYIAYREILLAMDLGHQIKLCNNNGGCFPTIAFGEETEKKKGRLTVTVVYGDIVAESTNAIVNPTDFSNWSADSVANRIFTQAGADVVRNARKGHNSGQKVVMTTAGPLSCAWILHCNCGGSLSNISDLVSEILNKCEHVGLQSVAIPSIGTGECKFRPENVATLMMKGILHVTENTNLQCLCGVRLVTYSPYIYHVFCAELRKSFI